MNPLVSIIIPVYNGQKYIVELIDNIRKLTYDNYEVIWVDDGSTDNTYKTLMENKKENYNIIKQDNAGVSAARNAGLVHAKGEYICFLDVDDFVNEKILDIFRNVSVENNCDVIFCDSSSQLCDVKNFTNIPIEIFNKDDALKDFVMRKIHTGVCGLFVKKSILDDNCLLFKQGYAYSEDLHMVMRIFNCTDRIVHIKLPLYNYREVSGSVMTKINEKRIDSIYLMEDLVEYFRTNNPSFYPFFAKYGVPRTSWAVLWQAAHFLCYNDFKVFITKYDFKKDIKKLLQFPDKKIQLSSILFVISKRMYYNIVKIYTRNYRKN